MNKIIAAIILATGIVLLVLGIGALNSFTSDISRMLTGVPTDRSIWLLGSGTLITLIGLVGVFNIPNKN